MPDQTEDEAPSRRRGRPRASSRADLEDAAAELFLERGYPDTTIADIARRAGVSRNAFFGYFPAKSDVLWVQVDAVLETLPEVLVCAEGRDRMSRVVSGLASAAATVGAGRIPLALTQVELMRTGDDLLVSATQRLLRLVAAVRAFLDASAPHPEAGLHVLPAASAVGAATAAAFWRWASAGVTRGPLEPYVRTAVEPVADGFRPLVR